MIYYTLFFSIIIVIVLFSSYNKILLYDLKTIEVNNR